MRDALQNGKASARAVARRMSGTTSAVLVADGPPRGLRRALRGGVDVQQLPALLDFLVNPPRDLESLELERALPNDPLGEHIWVRVWTTTDRYPPGEIEEAEGMLRLLVDVTGVPVAHGFDVLVTPGMGVEVFPRQYTLPWAAGICFVRDRYCAVRSRLPPRFRREVLRHELVHAYISQFTDGFISSRFVAEGLAEYLRLLQPGDYGLHAPVARFADNLALLQQVLEWMRRKGINTRRIDPRRLVRLGPWGFYGLAPFSYLVAQATMAHLGGDVIEKAFRSRSDAVIVEAVAGMSWKLFLEFVRTNARGGRAENAIVVKDPHPGEMERPATPRKPIPEALRELGAGVLPGRLQDRVGDLMRDAALESPQRIATVLRALRETGRGPVMLFTDLSAAMDRTIKVEVPEAYFGPQARKALEQSRPRAFVGGLARAMREAAPTVDLRLMPLSERTRLLPAVPDEVERFSAWPLPDWLNARGWQSPGLILCVATGFLPGPRTAKNRQRIRKRVADGYARLLKGMAVTPRAVLVVDLSDGNGDALAIARAFAARAGYAGLVACWNPQVTR